MINMEERPDESVKSGFVFIALVIITGISLCLPVGIIWLINQVYCHIEYTAKSYVLTSISLAGILAIIFIIDVWISKNKKEDEDSKKSN